MDSGYMYVAETDSETSSIEIDDSEPYDFDVSREADVSNIESDHSDAEVEHSDDDNMYVTINQDHVVIDTADDDVIAERDGIRRDLQDPAVVNIDIPGADNVINLEETATPNHTVITIEDDENRRNTNRLSNDSVIALDDTDIQITEGVVNDASVITIGDNAEAASRAPQQARNTENESSQSSVSDMLQTVSSRVQPSASASAAISNTSTATSSGSTEVKNSAVEMKGQKHSSDDEAEHCTICFERWENSGEHRLASLKCGHLFGQSCIVKWLSGPAANNKCPQCNAKAVKKDVRLIYAKALKMMDTSERDKALQTLEKERQMRQQVELESAQLRLNYQMAMDECKRLREEMQRQQTTLDTMRHITSSTGQSTHNTNPSAMTSFQAASNQNSQQNIMDNSKNFVLDKSIKISEEGKCRVMAYCPQVCTLCISQPSTNALFPGFGVKKLSSMDFKTSQYLTLHSQPIRDFDFQQGDASAMLLSCSLDKTVKLTNMRTNSVVQTYTLPVAVWSCTYCADDNNVLYAGLVNGQVHEFDMRNTSTSVRMLNSESRSPVLRIQYVPALRDQQDRLSGLLVGQLNRCSFYERQGTEYKPHVLQIDGSLCSMGVDAYSGHVLMTYRPNTEHPHVRHQLTRMRSTTVPNTGVSVCSLQPVHVFSAGSTQKLLTRNKLLPHPDQDDNLLVCACDEASSSLQVWEATKAGVKQRLQTTLTPIDVCNVYTQQACYMCTLTEKQLHLYRWQ